MKSRTGFKFLAAAMMAISGAHGTQASEQLERPGIEGQVTFFYYDTLQAPALFYGGLLGLKKTQDFGWVQIFQVTPGASIGIVGEGRGYHHPGLEKPVMLSIGTADIDGWHAYLKAQGLSFLLEPASKEAVAAATKQGGAPARTLLVQDPGGYTVEFFEWQ